MQLAIFDLDNTLLAGDSDYLWGQFLVKLGAVDAAEYEQTNRAFYAQYEAGTLDINAFLSFALKPLAENSKQQLDAWHQQFLAEEIVPLITQQSRRLVQQHRDAGHTLLIITATNHFVTAPIAVELGIEHIIATMPEMQNGEYTGQVTGVPSFQAGKITRLDDWLMDRGERVSESWFYSDSMNDVPLLEKVDHPFAVDPDERLLTHAEQQGWPVMSLRD